MIMQHHSSKRGSNDGTLCVYPTQGTLSQYDFTSSKHMHYSSNTAAAATEEDKEPANTLLAFSSRCSSLVHGQTPTAYAAAAAAVERLKLSQQHLQQQPIAHPVSSSR
jgi:hypothetical protein